MTFCTLYSRFSVCLIMVILCPGVIIAHSTFEKSNIVDDIVTVEMRRSRIVGAAVGIIMDNQIVYTKGYGYSDRKLRTPATGKTVFNWASNSKPLIAIAALQLVQDGRLKLDQPVTDYLPDLPGHLKHITTRHLLSHQSGIPHYKNGQIIPTGKTISPLQETDPSYSLNRFLMSPLIFEPGTRTEYSSYAYILLTAVVQAAGGEPVARQLSRRIEKPINLKSLQLDMPYSDQPNWTVAYKRKFGWTLEVTDYAHYWKHGAGGYKSDIIDFSKFALALMNNQLINAATTMAMWTPQSTSNGENSAYGLGVLVSGSGSSLHIAHDGRQDESRSQLSIYPHQKRAVVVLCNTQSCNPGSIARSLFTALAEN